MSRAIDHTTAMIEWWGQAGIDRVDLAVKRSGGAMIWHKDQPLLALPLAWVRAENVRQGEVYIRPSRERAWPLVFLDDVPEPMAHRIAGKYDVLLVRTSRRGGCHIWLRVARELEEKARGIAQRWLVEQIEADPGSVSGEHLGRLAGFRNWKRGGEWVNVLDSSSRDCPWDSKVATDTLPPAMARRVANEKRSLAGHDASPSGREWGWICGLLEAGQDPRVVRQLLAHGARARRGPDSERYAAHTLRKALRWRDGKVADR